MAVTKTRTVESLRFELMARKFARDVGQRIRHRRLELGLSQSQVAQRMPKPIEAQRVSKWERGENMPNDENLEGLSVALEVSVAYFHTDGGAGTGDLMGAMSRPNGNGHDPVVAELVVEVKRLGDLVTELLDREDASRRRRK